MAGHKGVQMDMSRASRMRSELERDIRDNISEELSVGFRPHPDNNEREDDLHLSGYLSDSPPDKQRRKVVEKVQTHHPSTAGRMPMR